MSPDIAKQRRGVKNLLIPPPPVRTTGLNTAFNHIAWENPLRLKTCYLFLEFHR